jgi:cysteinyl-tRNA synthetase
LSDDEIDALVEQRQQARADRDFATSDRIRDQLAEQGIVLEDKGDRTLWRRTS